MTQEQPTRLLDEWDELPLVCKLAMELAKLRPGTYGGRYVARLYEQATGRTTFFVLAEDDPDYYAEREDWDILAQVLPDKVLPMGRARHYLREDGSVHFEERPTT